MITIFHGTDQITSRKNFLVSKEKDSPSFDAISLNISDLEQSLSGSTLFGEGKKIFIENVFNRKAAKNFPEIIKLLNRYSKNSHVYIWADKEVGKKVISEFENVTDENYNIPVNIFAFLDSIRPKNNGNLINFHNSLRDSEVEIVFFMLVRQFRLLLGVSNYSSKSIDEIKRLAPWQMEKLKRQASYFGEEKLKEIYKKIYKIDKSVKTGKSQLTLTQNVDIMLLEI